MSLEIPDLGFVQTPTAERVVRRYLFKRTWDFMCKPGSPHYEAALRDLIVKETTGNTTNETGEKKARRPQTAERAKRRKRLLAGRGGQRKKTVTPRRTQAARRKLAARLRSLKLEK